MTRSILPAAMLAAATLATVTLATVPLASPASAQRGGPTGPDPRSPYDFAISGNNTGGVRSVIIPRGATGADTYFSSSAVGGNVQRPELAVPNGSAGGGGNGGGR